MNPRTAQVIHGFMDVYMIELCGLDATEHDHDWSVDFIQDIRINWRLTQMMSKWRLNEYTVTYWTKIHVSSLHMYPGGSSLSRYLDVSSTLGRLDIKTLVESTRYQGL
jgi:hypothetical protein